MKDLLRLADQCRNDLLSVGIQCGNVRSWSVNTRAKARWGLCKKIASNIFNIQIAEALLQDDITDQAALDTIAHELLHTAPGCFSHTGKWKQLAGKVNRLLPQYRIKVKTSCSENGLEDTRQAPEYRYLLKCQNCGTEIRRQKKSIVVDHPECYRGIFVSVKSKHISGQAFACPETFLLFNYDCFLVMFPIQALSASVAICHKLSFHGDTASWTYVVGYCSVFSQACNRHRRSVTFCCYNRLLQ